MKPDRRVLTTYQIPFSMRDELLRCTQASTLSNAVALLRRKQVDLENALSRGLQGYSHVLRLGYRKIELRTDAYAIIVLRYKSAVAEDALPVYSKADMLTCDAIFADTPTLNIHYRIAIQFRANFILVSGKKHALQPDQRELDIISITQRDHSNATPPNWSEEPEISSDMPQYHTTRYRLLTQGVTITYRPLDDPPLEDVVGFWMTEGMRRIECGEGQEIIT